jgi:7,8-dihydropterin-6-yl-methyl-4-(beta-D-ribofuranosyl)aminobenzene 5'-phosphate synthase
MNIKILYDNTAKLGFKFGWGFSVLIDDRTLFDMGENVESLRDNIRAFGVEVRHIERVVLSHNDWDHVGGLGLLSEMGVVDVFLPSGCSAQLHADIHGFNKKASIVEVTEARRVAGKLYLTGTLGLRKKEVSLIGACSQGNVLITGCAHPGLLKIMKSAAQFGDVTGVLGGFHGFRQLERLEGLEYIAPCHCTKKKDTILAMYPDTAVAVAAGEELDL